MVTVFKRRMLVLRRMFDLRRMVALRMMVVNLVKFADEGVAADPRQVSVAEQRRLILFVKLLSAV